MIKFLTIEDITQNELDMYATKARQRSEFEVSISCILVEFESRLSSKTDLFLNRKEARETFRLRVQIAALITVALGCGILVSKTRSNEQPSEIVDCTDGAADECVDLYSESEGVCVDASRMLLRCAD